MPSSQARLRLEPDSSPRSILAVRSIPAVRIREDLIPPRKAIRPQRPRDSGDPRRTHGRVQHAALRRGARDRRRSRGALALLDLDHFKPINDELGHAAGDAALRTFTSLIRHELSPEDVFARIGGHEFAVFFPGVPLESAVKVVESICARLARTPFRFNDATRKFSASVGLAVANGAEAPESLKRRADEALYEAKRQGRGRWVAG